ncbi:MAG: hypothetical protein AB1921_04810 [Thermodesulfobacteriota bacterium]
MRTRTQNDAGFTLTELIVATGLGLLLLTLVAQTFLLQNRVYKTHDMCSGMLQGGRMAMEAITRDVKAAGYDPTGAGITGLPVTAGRLRILADLNSDGDTLDAFEDITYTFDQQAGIIYKDLGTGPIPFAENVESFVYDYLDQNGNATATPANIRQVRISITTRTEQPDPHYADNQGYRTVTLRSLVTPYNLLA